MGKGQGLQSKCDICNVTWELRDDSILASTCIDCGHKQEFDLDKC